MIEGEGVTICITGTGSNDSITCWAFVSLDDSLGEKMGGRVRRKVFLHEALVISYHWWFWREEQGGGSQDVFPVHGTHIFGCPRYNHGQGAVWGLEKGLGEQRSED